MRPCRRISRFTAVLAGLAVATACAKDADEKDEGDEKAATLADANRTVLVLDDGFDETHPVFTGKIVGRYTIKCPERAEDAVDWDKMTDEEMRAKLLAAFAAETTCTVEETLEFNRSPGFATIAAKRDSWNAGILSKRGVALPASEVAQIVTIITGEGGAFRYHGTGTAGAIAFENPSVRLVLVQLKLSNAAEAETKVECHAQAGVDRFVRISREEAVMKAYVEAPIDAVSTKLDAITMKHGVSLVNLSLGATSRSALEKIYAQKGCGVVDLRELYTLEREKTERRNAFLKTLPPTSSDLLVVQAAGNDGAAVETPADSQQCSDPAASQLIVGAYDMASAISSFSNRGACVDVYALGEGVVVAAPDGFVNVSSGTSFSAPLVARHMSTYPKELNSAATYARIRAELDAERRLPLALQPIALAFGSKGNAIPAYALVETPTAEAQVGFDALLRRVPWLRAR